MQCNTTNGHICTYQSTRRFAVLHLILAAWDSIVKDVCTLCLHLPVTCMDFGMPTQEYLGSGGPRPCAWRTAINSPMGFTTLHSSLKSLPISWASTRSRTSNSAFLMPWKYNSDIRKVTRVPPSSLLMSLPTSWASKRSHPSNSAFFQCPENTRVIPEKSHEFPPPPSLLIPLPATWASMRSCTSNSNFLIPWKQRHQKSHTSHPPPPHTHHYLQLIEILANKLGQCKVTSWTPLFTEWKKNNYIRIPSIACLPNRGTQNMKNKEKKKEQQ